MNYEKVPSPDPNIPVTFHPDTDPYGNAIGFSLHWHEHLELLYFTHGSTLLYINNAPLQANEGELIVINSNCLHAMPAKPLECTYHCIIINKLFLDHIFTDSEPSFQEHITSPQVISCFESIRNELLTKAPFYKMQIQSYCTSLLILLARNHFKPENALISASKTPQTDMIKKSISYIHSHYQEEINIDALASYIGCSKYYLCHIFKEITHQTIVEFTNSLRCRQVKKLLSSGKYNVSQAAYCCGFNNLSYFSKTYQKYMGVLPSCETF